MAEDGRKTYKDLEKYLQENFPEIADDTPLMAQLRDKIEGRAGEEEDLVDGLDSLSENDLASHVDAAAAANEDSGDGDGGASANAGAPHNLDSVPAFGELPDDGEVASNWSYLNFDDAAAPHPNSSAGPATVFPPINTEPNHKFNYEGRSSKDTETVKLVYDWSHDLCGQVKSSGSKAATWATKLAVIAIILKRLRKSADPAEANLFGALNSQEGFYTLLYLLKQYGVYASLNKADKADEPDNPRASRTEHDKKHITLEELLHRGIDETYLNNLGITDAELKATREKPAVLFLKTGKPNLGKVKILKYFITLNDILANDFAAPEFRVAWTSTSKRKPTDVANDYRPHHTPQRVHGCETDFFHEEWAKADSQWYPVQCFRKDVNCKRTELPQCYGENDRKDLVELLQGQANHLIEFLLRVAPASPEAPPSPPEASASHVASASVGHASAAIRVPSSAPRALDLSRPSGAKGDGQVPKDDSPSSASSLLADHQAWDFEQPRYVRRIPKITIRSRRAKSRKRVTLRCRAFD